MHARAAAALSLLCLLACAKKADPLAPHRAECEKLLQAGQLKKGLLVEDCAKQLKAVADASDPKLRAAEVLDQLAALTAKGRASADESHKVAVRETIFALERLGRPAVPQALARMNESADPDFRIAVAKALVATCGDDCGKNDLSCIVPALLEGVGADKPSDVRIESQKSLMRCTGQQHGDDPVAWKNWWTGYQQRTSAK